MRSILFLPIVVAAMAAPAFAEDVEGSADHPVISRYPGSEIAWYVVDNYREYRLPVGPVTGYRHIDEWIDTEGRVTRVYYELKDSDRQQPEVYKNYRDALAGAGFEILAEGNVDATTRGGGIGSRQWQGVFFAENPFNETGPVDRMVQGSSSSGGSGTIIARKERAAGTVYVAASIYQYSAETLSTLVDVIEVAPAESGLIAVDAEAIGAGIEEHGRVVLDGILFEFDKAELMAESKPTLDEIAKYLNSHADLRFYVVGHTDSEGSFDYNKNLSSARAKAVVDALVADYGIDAARLEAHGVGPLSPVFTNTSEPGRERNRRVELVER